MSGLYGKNINISFNHTQTRSGIEDNEDTSTTLYVPEEIRIKSPEINSNDDMYPLCYHENFKIQWNKDQNNPDGVLFIVEWLGTMIYGNNHPDMYYRVVDHAETDNGEHTLNNKMFKDIPDTALCYLTIARGTVQNTTVDGETTYKILAETHATMPFILIKYIEDTTGSESASDGDDTEEAMP